MRRKAELLATTAAPTPLGHDEPRDRHGFRGVPPPAEFDLYALSDRAPLTEFETAAVGRWSTNTLAAWRRVPNHPLEWFVLPGGFIRYFAGSIKRYLSMGTPRRPRKADAAPKPKPPKRRPRPAGTPTATTEISHDVAPERRRAPAAQEAQRAPDLALRAASRSVSHTEDDHE